MGVASQSLPEDVLAHQLKFGNVLVVDDVRVERRLGQQVGPGQGGVHQSVS